jgi:hypothetical protein
MKGEDVTVHLVDRHRIDQLWGTSVSAPGSARLS